MAVKFWEVAPPGYKLRSEIERLKRRRNIFLPGDEEPPPEEPPVNPIEADMEKPESFPLPPPFTPEGVAAFRGGGPPGVPSPFLMPTPEEVSTPLPLATGIKEFFEPTRETIRKKGFWQALSESVPQNPYESMRFFAGPEEGPALLKAGRLLTAGIGELGTVGKPFTGAGKGAGKIPKVPKAVAPSVETTTRDIVSTDIEVFDKLNPILKNEVTANIRRKIPELEEMISDYESQVYGLTEALKENGAKDYIGLLQKQGNYRGEVQYLTPGQYRQMTGATWQTKKIQIGDKVVNKRMLVGGREAPPGAKDAKGRIVFEYAADELADRLYPPNVAEANGFSSSTDMFRAKMHEAKRIMDDLDDARKVLADANEDWRSYNNFLEMSITRLPTPEGGMPEAGIQAGFGGETKVVRPEGKGKITQISMEDQLKLAQARQAALPPPTTVGKTIPPAVPKPAAAVAQPAETVPHVKAVPPTPPTAGAVPPEVLAEYPDLVRARAEFSGQVSRELAPTRQAAEVGKVAPTVSAEAVKPTGVAPPAKRPAFSQENFEAIVKPEDKAFLRQFYDLKPASQLSRQDIQNEVASAWWSGIIQRGIEPPPGFKAIVGEKNVQKIQNIISKWDEGRLREKHNELIGGAVKARGGIVFPESLPPAAVPKPAVPRAAKAVAPGAESAAAIGPAFKPYQIDEKFMLDKLQPKYKMLPQDEIVRVYRGLRGEAPAELRGGDWVTPDFETALRVAGGDRKKVLQADISASELYAENATIGEYIYAPIAWRRGAAPEVGGVPAGLAGAPQGAAVISPTPVVAAPSPGIIATQPPITPAPPVTATPTGRGVGGIPPIKTSLAPTGEAPAVIPKGVQDAMAQSVAIIKRDAPGAIVRAIDAIPGLRETQRYIGNKALGMKKYILSGWIGLGHTHSQVSTTLKAELGPILDSLETSFGKGATKGRSIVARFIGPDAQRVPFSGTLYDVMQRPNLYDLTDAQRQLLRDIQAKNSGLLNQFKELYGFDMNEFNVGPDAVFLRNVDMSKAGLAMAKSEEKALIQGATKERFYQTGGDRWLHDKALFDQGKITADQVFKPNTNVAYLLDANDTVISSLSAHEVFKTSLGGKTKLELFQELHPGAIPDSKQLDMFNPRGHVLVTEGGLDKYFPAADAKEIKRLLKRSESPILHGIDDLRATAFGGDLSPGTIQGINAWMMDPIGVTKTLAHEMKQAAKEHKFLNAFSEAALEKRVRDNPEIARMLTQSTGLSILRGVQREEFGAGLLAHIPKVGKYWQKFNDAVYRPLITHTWDSWEAIYNAGLQNGLSKWDAAAIAADDVTKLIPNYSWKRLGMSQAEATHRRVFVTSVSFITQPTAMISDAVKGILKTAMPGKKATPTEVYAMKRILTMATMSSAISATTAGIYAQRKGRDVEQAMIDAVKPVNWAITLPNGDKIGIAGTYKAVLRAVAPGDVPGLPVPVPFAGLGRFIQSKTHPVIRIGIEEVQNKDYYDRQIRTGQFPVNVFQGLLHAGAGILPLTGGAVAKGAIAGATPGYIAKQAGAQFAGLNLSENIPDKLQSIAEEKGLIKPTEVLADNPKLLEQVKQSPEGRSLLEQKGTPSPLEQSSQRRREKQVRNDSYLGDWTGTGWSNSQKPDPANPGRMIPYTVTQWREDLRDMYAEAATEWATREKILGEFKGKEPKDERGKARWDYYKIADKYTEKDKDGKPIPGGKIQDMDGFIQEQDDFLASLTPELEKHVLDNLGIHDEKWATKFREDKRQLRDYFNRDEILSKAWEKIYHYNPEFYLNLAKIARERGTAQDLADAQTYEQTYRLKDYERFKVQRTQKYLETNPQVDMLVWRWGYRDNPVNPTERQRMGLQPLPGQGIIRPKTSSGIGKIPSKIGAR